MKYNPRVVKCVLEHYSGEWRGNTKEIKERYKVLGRPKGFIDSCKEFARDMGGVFVYNIECNTFTCVDGRSDDVEKLVKKTLKNHYDQGKSTRRDMSTMHSQKQIGSNLYELFVKHQQNSKHIINSLSDES